MGRLSELWSVGSNGAARAEDPALFERRVRDVTGQHGVRAQLSGHSEPDERVLAAGVAQLGLHSDTLAATGRTKTSPSSLCCWRVTRARTARVRVRRPFTPRVSRSEIGPCDIELPNRTSP